MVAPEGSEYSPILTLKAAESLVRSLVGVAGVSLKADAKGVLREILIVPEPGVSDRRIGRDVLSALQARFGVTLDPGAITVAAPEAETDGGRVRETDWPVSSVSDEAPGKRRLAAVPERNGNVGGIARDGTAASGGVRVPKDARDVRMAAPEQGADAGFDVPRLELAQIEPVERGLRCRIAIVVGAERFDGVAEAPTGFTAEAELAARVTLDAMRSARTPREPLQFRGVQLLDLAGQPHVVVSLAVWTGNDFEALAGAEPVRTTVAEAAARAILGSLTIRMHAETPPGI